ncbi:uroporphyrinogen decarboxylase family protein [Clostridium sp. Marseille-Q2269]|uniref:uroporphyrinogen decarboxylase family protein n=1 Tax=Clostridium sp. Marseille-Q2269 TaxID=2942205 RepID=UPI002073CB1B|nr:uroporphyrinogen decarboxylase family protein [Clostridium sp. Marseille-Q2269]
MNLLEYMSKKRHRLIYPQMGAIGIAYTNYTMYEVYKDPQKQLEIALLLEDKIPLDFSYPLDYGVVFAEALGVPLLRPDYDFPSSNDNPIKDLSDLLLLDQPCPEKNCLMSSYLEAIRLIAENIDKPEMVALVGPFTLAAEMAGVENLARCVIRKPDFVEAILDFATEAIINFLRTAVKNGAKVIQISEPTASIISPVCFSRFITHRLQKIFATAEQLGAWGVLHICGNTSVYLKEMSSCGAEVLSLDQIMDMATVAKIVPENIILAGNIDPLQIMYNGSSYEVEKATKKLLLDMKLYPNFMPSFGCDCVMGSPEENVKIFIKTVYENS